MWLELFLVVIAFFGYMSWKQKKSKEFWYERGVPNTNEEIEMKWGKESMFDVCIRLYHFFIDSLKKRYHLSQFSRCKDWRERRPIH